MKKLFLLLGCLAALTACQTIAAEPNPTTQVSSPSAMPATATASATATRLPATPVPLFFSEEFNADLGAWASFQTGGAEAPEVGLKTDLLQIEFTSPNTWYYAIHNAHEYSHVLIRAAVSGTSAGSLGLICQYSEAKGWYEFNLASNGTYSLLFGQWLKQDIAQYTPIEINTSEYLQAGNLTYEIGMTCENNTLLLQINEKVFRKVDVTRYGLSKGKVGINASSFDEVPMTANFDWVKVESPK
jgi:hypothetical protein